MPVDKGPLGTVSKQALSHGARPEHRTIIKPVFPVSAPLDHGLADR